MLTFQQEIMYNAALLARRSLSAYIASGVLMVGLRNIRLDHSVSLSVGRSARLLLCPQSVLWRNG